MCVCVDVGFVEAGSPKCEFTTSANMQCFLALHVQLDPGQANSVKAICRFWQFGQPSLTRDTQTASASICIEPKLTDIMLQG